MKNSTRILSALKLFFQCIFIYFVVPFGIILLTHYLLMLKLKIGPLIILASLIASIGISAKLSLDLDFSLFDTQKKLKVTLFLVIPIALLALYPLYDMIVYILVGTSPLAMLGNLFGKNYFFTGISNILAADEDLIFYVFLNLIQYILFIGTILVVYFREVSPNCSQSKPVEESEEMKLIKLIMNTDSISLRRHEYRENLKDFVARPRILIVTLMLVVIYVLIPIISLLVLAAFLVLDSDWGFLLSLIIEISVYSFLIKRLILRMNAYSAFIRTLFFIAVPAIIVYMVFLFKPFSLLISSFGDWLDGFFVSLFKMPYETEPLGFAEAIANFIGIGQGIILLIGLRGFSLRCPKCKSWYDPYRLINSSGPVAYYDTQENTYFATGTVSRVYESGEVDIDVDIEKIKTDHQYSMTEFHYYQCQKCGRKETRKLTKNI